MAGITLGIFSDRMVADRAVDDLQESGFNPKDISIIMKDQVVTGSGETTGKGEQVAGGAVSGATTGGVVGGIAGLLIGIGALTIPGVGALLIGGPVAAALGLTGAAATTVSGALTGALAGGLVGALVGLGIPEEEAKVYEQRISEGAVLVAVPSTGSDGMEARVILERHGAEQTRFIENADRWR
jgi:hypothetical protein